MVDQTHQKTRKGIIVSNKMDKTVTVRVERTYSHPRYKKVIRRSKNYYAHHEKEKLQIGAKVLIRETRPLSKLKRWIVIRTFAASPKYNQKSDTQ